MHGITIHVVTADDHHRIVVDNRVFHRSRQKAFYYTNLKLLFTTGRNPDLNKCIAFQKTVWIGF